MAKHPRRDLAGRGIGMLASSCRRVLADKRGLSWRIQTMLPTKLARFTAIATMLIAPVSFATAQQSTPLTLEDAEQWLRSMFDMGIADFSVSDDEFHSAKGDASPGAIAYRAAKKLGLPCAKICISPPKVSLAPDSGVDKGQPVTGGGVLFKGRAAEKLTAGLPVRPWRTLITCPHEEVANPERVHVDAYGNVHVCQGLSIGNMWSTPLSELVRDYDASKHPIVGPLVEGGPARLAERFELKLADAYVDECHLCYMARKSLLPAFPQYLAPAQVYGL